MPATGRQPEPSADPAAEDAPRDRSADQPALQEAQHRLTDDQADRPAEAPGDRAAAGVAGGAEPGAVAGRGGGVEAIAARPADRQAGPGVADPDAVGPDELDVEIEAEQGADGAGEGEVGGSLEVDRARRGEGGAERRWWSSEFPQRAAPLRDHPGDVAEGPDEFAPPGEDRPGLGAGEALQVGEVGVAGADGDDLDPLAAVRTASSTAASGASG